MKIEYTPRAAQAVAALSLSDERAATSLTHAPQAGDHIRLGDGRTVVTLVIVRRIHVLGPTGSTLLLEADLALA